MISSIVSRLVILVFGTLYPAYASYKAVRTKNVKEYVKWMMYWIVFALFSCAETFTDVFLSFWFPFYYEIKIILVIWLLSPATKGSSILYRKFVHPMLSRREQEIDEYIAKAKEQGYHTVLHLGTKGVNYATTVLMQTAIKGGGGLVNQLRRSYSLSDLSSDKESDMNRNSKALTNVTDEEDLEEEEADGLDPRMLRPRGYSPRRSASGSGRVEMYFPEVDVDVRQHGSSRPREPSIPLSHIRSSEDVSSGYSSAEPLYAGHHATKSEGLAASREPLVRTASVGSTRSMRTKSSRGGVVAKRVPAAEDSEFFDLQGDDVDYHYHQKEDYFYDMSSSLPSQISESIPLSKKMTGKPTATPLSTVPEISPIPATKNQVGKANSEVNNSTHQDHFADASDSKLEIAEDGDEDMPLFDAETGDSNIVTNDLKQCEPSVLSVQHVINSVSNVNSSISGDQSMSNSHREADVAIFNPDSQNLVSNKIPTETELESKTVTPEETDIIDSAKESSKNDDSLQVMEKIPVEQEISNMASDLEVKSEAFSHDFEQRSDDLQLECSHSQEDDNIVQQLSTISKVLEPTLGSVINESTTLGPVISKLTTLGPLVNESNKSESINSVVLPINSVSLSQDASEVKSEEVEDVPKTSEILENEKTEISNDKIIQSINIISSSINEISNKNEQITKEVRLAPSIPESDTVEVTSIALSIPDDTISETQNATASLPFTVTSAKSLSPDNTMDISQDSQDSKCESDIEQSNEAGIKLSGETTDDSEFQNDSKLNKLEVETVKIEVNIPNEDLLEEPSQDFKPIGEASGSAYASVESLEVPSRPESQCSLKKESRAGKYHKHPAPTPPRRTSESESEIGTEAEKKEIAKLDDKDIKPSVLTQNEKKEDVSSASEDETAVTARLVLKPGVVKSVGPDSRTKTEIFVSKTPQVKSKKSKSKGKHDSSLSRFFALPKNQFGGLSSLFPFWHGKHDNVPSTSSSATRTSSETTRSEVAGNTGSHDESVKTQLNKISGLKHQAPLANCD